MKPDAPIPTIALDPDVTLAHARPWMTGSATTDSPAISVMTDLTQVKAASTAPSTSLQQAEQMMIYLGVRMLFVVSAMPSIDGLLTTTDLHGENQMRLTQERHTPYADLCVADVMSELSMLDAMAFDQVRFANVGNVIATLKRLGRNHLLVVDRAEASTVQRIRGIFSRAQIERQTGLTIEIMPVANSFAEIERALN